MTKKYKALLKKLKVELELYERYVDDVTEGLLELDPGVRFDAEKVKMVKVAALVENDKEIEGDKRTMNELQKDCKHNIPKCPVYI